MRRGEGSGEGTAFHQNLFRTLRKILVSVHARIALKFPAGFSSYVYSVIIDPGLHAESIHNCMIDAGILVDWGLIKKYGACTATKK